MKGMNNALELIPADSAVWVLADFNTNDWPGEPHHDEAVVWFRDWGVVRTIYRLVKDLRYAAQRVADESKAGGFQVTGISVEIVDTPSVRAWFSLPVANALNACRASLGDGILLAGREAAEARQGDEMKSIILEVRDDGMLLVKCDDGWTDGWATIDLTALVEAGRACR